MIRRILRIFFGNIPFKIFAIVLALSVWILAVLIRPQTVNITVPIKLTNLPQDLVVTKINTDKVNVILQGHGTDFVKFLLRPPLYNLDLALAKPGTYRVKFAPDELAVSAPVLLKSINPEYSEVTIERLDSKPVTILIPRRIEPHKGIYITNVTTQDMVILSGPESEMQFIKEITTESLFVSDYSALQTSRKLRVVLPDTKYYQVKPDSITVIASIEKEATKILAEIPVNIIPSAQYQSTVKPKTATITLRGAKSKIDSLQSLNIKLNINVLKLNVGEYKIPAEISLPKGIILVRCEPQFFEVKIR